MFRVLVVEDDANLNKSMCSYLNHNGYEATGCLEAESAYDKIFNTVFDLIISDVMMPKIDGFEFAQAVRTINHDIPIIFVTARDDFASKQRGFNSGIDDYMVKPIDLEELLLRMGALLRRAKIAEQHSITIGTLTMNVDERTATIDGEEVAFTVREFNILFKLLSYPNKAFTRTQLMDEFWDAGTASGPRTVDVYMTKLRDKVSSCKDFEIKTVHGLGYKAVIK